MTIRVVALLIRHDGGGAEKSVKRVKDAIVEFGVRLDPVALDPPREGERADVGKSLSRGVERKVPALFTNAWRLRSLLTRDKPDVLHLHCERPELVGMLALAMCRVRPLVVVTEHSRNQWSNMRLVGRITRKSLSLLGATFVKCYQGEPGSASLTIFNPMESVFNTIPETSVDEPARLIVLSRLVPAKQIPVILHAAAAAEWLGEIVIIGDGPERPACERLASTLGLNIRFFGYLENPWEVVQAGDVMVSASAYEGEPLALIEAVARRVPIAVSDIGAHRALLGDSVTYFSSGGELAAVLSTIHQSGISHLRVPEALRERIIAERDPGLVAAQWRVLYGNLMSGVAPGEKVRER